MKRLISALLAFVSALLAGAARVSAAGVSPAAGDNPYWWLYAILAVVAAALIVVLVVTGRKKK